MSIEQLTLNLHERDDATWANFYVGENQKLVKALQELEDLSQPLVYLWGKSGVGITHLLLASCNQFNARNFNAMYVSLKDPRITPEFFLDLEQVTWLGIDDVDVMVDVPAWAETIFYCLNERLNRKVVTIFGAHATPEALSLTLLDLKSRLNSGLLFAVQELDDAGRLAALQLRAKFLRLDLPLLTARFLLTHYVRDLRALFALLKKLDYASLAAQRCLTIPFVKQFMYH